MVDTVSSLGNGHSLPSLLTKINFVQVQVVMLRDSETD